MHRTDALASVRSRLGDRLARRIATQVGFRPDLYLGDVRMAGNDLATIAVGYSPDDYPAPSVEEVTDFVIKASAGKVQPHAQTMRLHREEGAVTVNVAAARQFVALNDESRQHFAPLGGKRYLSASAQEVWELEDVEGAPVLFRVAEENLDALLATMSGSKMRSSSVRIARCQDSIPMVPLQAEVSFHDRAGQYRVAKVLSEPTDEGMIRIAMADTGTEAVVHINQVEEVLRTAELDGSTKSKLESYFAEMFGDKEYAKNLVREGSAEAPATITGTAEEFTGFLVDSGMYDVNAATLELDKLRRDPHKVHELGPQNIPGLVLGMFNGNGFEWEIDVEAAEGKLG